MKYKILISCLFFGFFTLTTHALPMHKYSAHITINSSDLKPTLHHKTLNINLPFIPKRYQREATNNIKVSTNESETILKNSKKSYKIKLLVLRKTKNAVLKAVLKRKSYGLRYTRRWWCLLCLPILEETRCHPLQGVVALAWSASFFSCHLLWTSSSSYSFACVA